MKHFYTLLVALMISVTSFAQLPDGSVAPDWTVTDLNGNTWHLQSLLDEGKTVIVDFSATWCGPCWGYHNTHILRDLYDAFGPNGTDDLMVFFFEGDDQTTLADLQGTGASTQGDWVAGTTYPIVDNTGGIFDDYAGAYFPTIYTICPDGILTESGQVSFDDHLAIAFGGCDNSISGAAPVIAYNGDATACDGGWNASVALTNYGSSAVTSATFEVTLNGTAQPDVNWTGSVATNGNATVDLGTYNATGNISISLVSVNGEPWASATAATVVASEEAMSLIRVNIKTDNWGEETSWNIKNSAGQVIQQVAANTLSDVTEYNWWVNVPAEGCYSFTVNDAYGDGLFGSQWGGGSVNGFVNVYSYDNNQGQFSTIYAYNGTYDFELESAGANVTGITVDVAELDVVSSAYVFPNPVNNQATIEFSLEQNQNVSVQVFNTLGARVLNRDLGVRPAGEQREVLDFSSLQAGVYVVSIQAGNAVTTLRITKQ
jgi:hypothetical protein